MLNLVLVAVGILLLAVGGEALIRGALGAARRFGVSPLLSGLVIVGFGTSTPELVVSVNAALDGQPGIAIGNVVGSNIGNVLLILGLCAIITPLGVQPLALRRDAVTVIGASVLFMLLIMDGALGRIGALILLAALAAYLTWAYRTERAPSHSAPGEMHAAEAAEIQAVPPGTAWIIGALALGLALLIGGSQVLLKGAIGLAEALQISDAAIGLTLVAVGTSLPELTVSVIAALRRHADVAVGNILGSNIFNLLGILGIAGLITPMPMDARILAFDQWVMLATAVVLLGFLYTGRRLSRMEGAVLLSAYIIYVIASFTLVGS